MFTNCVSPSVAPYSAHVMIPEKDLIITRLGERDIDLGGPGVSGDVLVYIDEALSLIQD